MSRASVGDVLALFGVRTTAEAQGKIDRLFSAVAKIDSFDKRLRVFESERTATELETVIAAGRANGAITDVNESKVRAKGVLYARQFVGDAVPPVRVEQRFGQPQKEDGAELVPTPEEREVAKIFGSDPMDVAKNRGASAKLFARGSTTPQEG